MRPLSSNPFVHADMRPALETETHAINKDGSQRFERLALRLRRAGLIWAQAEPGHIRWSLAGDYLTTLIADSAWIRRQVEEVTTAWKRSADAVAEEIIPSIWVLPSSPIQRADGLAFGAAIAITSHIASAQGSLRALCQSASMDFQLTSDLLRNEPVMEVEEIPRIAAMVRLLQPVPLHETTSPAVQALLRAVETTHRCVRGHSERTAQLAERLAMQAGMSTSECQTARLSGLLHDVGKMGIPEHILRKPGALTADERAMVNLHPEIGQRIVEGVGNLERTLPAVLWHHERWDGAGYPHQLAGEAIPKIARIMSIADSFDAMRSDRAYRGALEPALALQEINDGAGNQFDPKLAQSFVQLLDREPALAA